MSLPPDDIPPLPKDLLEEILRSRGTEPNAPLPPESQWIHRLDPPWRERIQELLAGPDPRAALSRLLLMPDAIAALPWNAALMALFHQGSYAARLLGIYLEQSPPPTLRDELFESELRFRSKAELIAEFRQRLPKHPRPETLLGTLRTREYLRIIRGECESAPVAQICLALSELASACVEAALQIIDPKLGQQLVVFGMGKLGGHELNFLSDIDLLLVHDGDCIDAENENRAHRQRTQLFTKIRRVLKVLEGQGPFRPLFRVDLRLRPFGSRGPLSMSMPAVESYYERFGRDWERQAWIRARPIAGRLDLGEQLLLRLRPFVYRRSMSPQIFSEVESLMRRAKAQAKDPEAAHGPGFNLKLDRGGIREIEFFVQALQLLHGGKNPAVKSPSTLRALDQLAAEGLISDREHETLSQAYGQWRRLEHLVQIQDGQQTHLWPDAQNDRELLLRRHLQNNSSTASEAPPLAPLSLATFDERLQTQRQAVMAICATLRGPAARPEEIDPQEKARRNAFALICDPGARSSLRRKALRAIGLRDPDGAEAMIDHLMTRPGSAFAESGPAKTGALALLRACFDSADPDHALARLSEYAALRPAHVGVWRLFAEPSQEFTVRKVADLFGASLPLSRALIGFPSRGHESHDTSLALLKEVRATHLPTLPEHLEAMAAVGQRAKIHEHAADIETVADQLLRFKNGELVRLGLVDLGQRADPLAVGRVLSDLADLILRSLLRHFSHYLRREFQTLPDITLSVLAMGKYGMQAMDYGSDLDLMFVFESHDADPALAQAPVAKLVRRFIQLLSTLRHGARLYEVDTRLRPSGNSGLLVSSFEAFSAYHTKALPVWERVALMRTRAVAELRLPAPRADADPAAIPHILPQPLPAHDPPAQTSLSHRICEEILETSLKRGPCDPPTIFAQLRAIKTRVEQELARESENHWNLKIGRGGCMDFEFLVSGLVLARALDVSAPRPSPALIRSELITQAKQLQAKGELEAGLWEAYLFQRQVLNRLRLCAGSGPLESGGDRLSTLAPGLDALARRMGTSDRQELLERLQNDRNRIAAAFGRAGV